MCLRRVNEGLVLMENNFMCQIISIGNILVRSHDGTNRTLSGVQHAPDLKKNLLLLGLLKLIDAYFLDRMRM